MKVRLVTPDAPDGAVYSWLTVGKEYEVLGIECDKFRLINDRSEPVLYDPTCFQVTDAAEPDDWVSRVIDGARYAYPPAWERRGFFEDWHDRNPEVRRQFSEELARRVSQQK